MWQCILAFRDTSVCMVSAIDLERCGLEGGIVMDDARVQFNLVWIACDKH